MNAEKVSDSVGRANKNTQCGSVFAVREEIVVMVRSYSPINVFDSDGGEDEEKMIIDDNDKVGVFDCCFV